MKVDRGGFQVGVAQHHLNTSQVGAGLEKVGRETMPKRVWRNMLLNACTERCFPNCLPDNFRSNRLVRAPMVNRAGEQVVLRLHPPVILAKTFKELFCLAELRDQCRLSLLHTKHHPFAVDILHLKAAHLSPP